MTKKKKKKKEKNWGPKPESLLDEVIILLHVIPTLGDTLTGSCLKPVEVKGVVRRDGVTRPSLIIYYVIS
jgi:hypothetical protein